MTDAIQVIRTSTLLMPQILHSPLLRRVAAVVIPLFLILAGIVYLCRDQIKLWTTRREMMAKLQSLQKESTTDEGRLAFQEVLSEINSENISNLKSHRFGVAYALRPKDSVILYTHYLFEEIRPKVRSLTNNKAYWKTDEYKKLSLAGMRVMYVATLQTLKDLSTQGLLNSILQKNCYSFLIIKIFLECYHCMRNAVLLDIQLGQAIALEFAKQHSNLFYQPGTAENEMRLLFNDGVDRLLKTPGWQTTERSELWVKKDEKEKPYKSPCL